MITFPWLTAKQAKQYQRALEARRDACERAVVEMPYSGLVIRPPIEKRGGKWFAIIEAGPSVPKVEKRQ